MPQQENIKPKEIENNFQEKNRKAAKKNLLLIILSSFLVLLLIALGVFLYTSFISSKNTDPNSENSVNSESTDPPNESDTPNNEDSQKYSELAHCSLNRDEFQSLIPDEIETSSVLSPSQQEDHLDEIVRMIKDSNIRGEEIVERSDFKQKVEDIRQEIKAGIETSQYYIQVKELVALIDDQHSAFLTPEETEEYDNFFQAPKSSLSAGISLVSCVDPWDESGAALITYVYEGGPAKQAGIQPFQLVTEINSEPTVIDGKLNLAIGDEKVREYKILDYDGNEQTYNIELEDVIPNHVFYLDRESYHYFNIKSFTVTNVNDFNDLYYDEAADDDRPIVIDLRFNTGGDVYALEKLLRNFFETGTKVGVNRSKIYADQDVIVGKSDPISDREIYIWTWFLTDSSSQIFSGVMKEQQKAELIGVNLDGNIETISAATNYVDNSKMINAIKVFEPISGNLWHEEGIDVDYQIGDIIWGKFSTEDDPYHLKTLDLVK
jgi:C-terminal processing protease CtpA/Prc